MQASPPLKLRHEAKKTEKDIGRRRRKGGRREGGRGHCRSGHASSSNVIMLLFPLLDGWIEWEPLPPQCVSAMHRLVTESEIQKCV